MDCGIENGKKCMKEYSKYKEFYITAWYGLMGILCCFILWLVVLAAIRIDSVSYATFDISDWLINYSGGFVRRGLFGEFLYIFYNLCPLNIKYVILCICISSFLSFLYLFYKCCKAQKMSILPLLVTICGALSPIYWYRRDFIILLISYLIYSLYVRYLKSKEEVFFIAFLAMSSLSILIHEGGAFFTFPILFIIQWFSEDNKFISYKKFVRGCKHFIIPFVVMLLVSFYKGNELVAETIWKSWTSLFEHYPDEANITSQIGDGVAFLYENTISATKFHLQLNFHINDSLFMMIWYVCSFFILLFCTYYLTERNFLIKEGKIERIESQGIKAGNILLFQFLAMLPMLTIFSCDYGRTIMYCVTSSILLSYVLTKYNYVFYTPSWLENVSEKFDVVCGDKRYMSSPWMYILVVCLYPMGYFGGMLFPIDTLVKRMVGYVYHSMF